VEERLQDYPRFGVLNEVRKAWHTLSLIFFFERRSRRTGWTIRPPFGKGSTTGRCPPDQRSYAEMRLRLEYWVNIRTAHASEDGRRRKWQTRPQRGETHLEKCGVRGCPVMMHE